MTLGHRLGAEFLGTAALLAIVVGSGVMGDRLSAGNAAMALLANSVATGCGLYVLILSAAAVSGAHFNPIVTALTALEGSVHWRDAAWYVAVQVIGAVVGVWLAHLMFDLSVIQISTRQRSGAGQWLSEVVATFGLVTVLLRCRVYGVLPTASAVAAYICAAYWFTASTSFANPAVTLARAMTDTFAGISPRDAPAFVASQLAGGALAFLLVGRHPPRRSMRAREAMKSGAAPRVGADGPFARKPQHWRKKHES